ncbi:type II secretion system protein GspG, partial [candidate division CSSED10-310 bacterium]
KMDFVNSNLIYVREYFRQEKTVHYDKENITPLSAENILMAGVQIVDEWPRIEKRIPDFELVLQKKELPPGSKVVIQRDEEDEDFELPEGKDEKAAESEGKENLITLSQEEELAYALVDGERTVQVIIDACHQGEFETVKALYSLLNEGLVEFTTEELPERIEEEKETPRFEAVKEKLGYVGVLLILAIVFIVLPINPIQAIKNVTDSIGIIFNPDMQTGHEILADVNQIRIDKIHFALKIYYLNNRSFPNSLENLVDEQYIQQKDLQDVWGNSFQLTLMEQGFQLSSIGPDGVPKTSDDMVITDQIADNTNEAIFFPRT